jgi:hypothetical protein
MPRPTPPREEEEEDNGLTYYQTQARMLSVASAHTHRMAALLILDGNWNGASLWVAPAPPTLTALEAQVRTHWSTTYYCCSGDDDDDAEAAVATAMMHWKITAHVPFSSEPLKARAYAALRTQDMGWTPVPLHIHITSAST